AYLSAQTEGGGVEAVDGGGVGHLKGDGFDGSHGDQASCGSVTRASRFLIGLVTRFANGGKVPHGMRSVVHWPSFLSAGASSGGTGWGVPGRNRCSFGLMNVLVRADDWLPSAVRCSCGRRRRRPDPVQLFLTGR